MDLAPRRRVDNRLSLKIYLRAADSVLKQANIYRREGNNFQLYVLLLRYAGLVLETIPQHRHYRSLGRDDKAHLQKKSVEVVQELELLRPKAKAQLQPQRIYPVKFPTPLQQEQQSTIQFNSNVYSSTQLKPGDQFYNLSLNLPTPKAETLARHSFIALQNVRAADTPLRVQYPALTSNVPADLPVDRIETQVFQAHAEVLQPPVVESQVLQPSAEEPIKETPQSQFDLVNQLAPPPAPVPVETLEVIQPVITTPELDIRTPVNSKEPRQLYLSARIMEEFLEVAKANTRNSIETCGVLAGCLEGDRFSVTTLIIPKQQATANTCETVNEEEIFDAQDKRGLFQLGWIHTHPTQSCFMSSVDLHTHYSYQVMLEEAIAIVMAPQDTRKCGIFRLSDPGGVNLIQKCSKRGFHAHEPTSDGSPIYEKCSHVFLDPKARFEVMDLR